MHINKNNWKLLKMLDPNVINNQPSSNLTTIENLHHYDFW